MSGSFISLGHWSFKTGYLSPPDRTDRSEWVPHLQLEGAYENFQEEMATAGFV